MKKIPTLFVRDPENMKLVTEQVTPGLEWVLDGHCVAREKLDGTSCAIFSGRLYKRHTTKVFFWPNLFIPSDLFVPSNGTDGAGKQPGWVPVGDGPKDRWHQEALANDIERLPDGTYELVGPKVQGNSYGHSTHYLQPHNATAALFVGDLSFFGIKKFLGQQFIEGIVFWGPEGPVTKIKRRDFGLPWPVREDG